LVEEGGVTNAGNSRNSTVTGVAIIRATMESVVCVLISSRTEMVYIEAIGPHPSFFSTLITFLNKPMLIKKI